MRYKCVANPKCLKTFEYGHTLKAHIASCVEAQKKLKEKSNVEKLEHEIGSEYAGMQGLHANPYYPIANHLDKTDRFQFKDRFRFNGNSKLPESFNNKDAIRPVRMPVQSIVHNSSQVKQTLTYQS